MLLSPLIFLVFAVNFLQHCAACYPWVSAVVTISLGYVGKNPLRVIFIDVTMNKIPLLQLWGHTPLNFH